MATIDEVKAWVNMGGVHHIAASTQGGWSHTICDIFSTYGVTQVRPEKLRLCRACRKALRKAVLTKPAPVAP